MTSGDSDNAPGGTPKAEPGGADDPLNSTLVMRDAAAEAAKDAPPSEPASEPQTDLNKTQIGGTPAKLANASGATPEAKAKPESTAASTPKPKDDDDDDLNETTVMERGERAALRAAIAATPLAKARKAKLVERHEVVDALTAQAPKTKAQPPRPNVPRPRTPPAKRPSSAPKAAAPMPPVPPAPAPPAPKPPPTPPKPPPPPVPPPPPPPAGSPAARPAPTAAQGTPISPEKAPTVDQPPVLLDPAPPNSEQPQPKPGRLTLSQFASLTAELEEYPKSERARIVERYSMTTMTVDREKFRWAMAFIDDDELMTEFKQLVEAYRRGIRERQGG